MVCIVWGLHFIVMKMTVNETADPLFYAAIRMSIVAFLLSPKLKWHKGMMGKLCVAGLGYGALNYAFMFPALGMTTAAAAAVTIELFVPFSIILSVIFLGERISLGRISGITLAFLGVILIAISKPGETAGPLFLLGIFMMAGAAMSEAVGAIMVKKLTGIKPLELLSWFALIGAVVLSVLSYLLEDNQMTALSPDNRLAFGLALLYSALLVSIISHASYYWLLQRLPVSTVATSGLMTTVIAVIASVLILGESLTPAFILGGIMTVIGVGVILQLSPAKPPSAEQISQKPVP